MEFKGITTQEEFDAAIAERLKRQKETIEAKYQDYHTLKNDNVTLKTQLGKANEALEAGKTGTEDLNKQIADLTGKVGKYELSNLKTTIALQNGIPFDLADRLNGEDEASIIEDAKRLASYIGNTEPIAPLKSSEPIGTKTDGYKNLLEGLNFNY